MLAYNFALVLVVTARDIATSFAVQAEILDESTTFLFYSRPGVLLIRANHLVNMELGNLLMSRSLVILQRGPWGQWHPTRWQAVQNFIAGLVLLTEGIMLVPM